MIYIHLGEKVMKRIKLLFIIVLGILILCADFYINSICSSNHSSIQTSPGRYSAPDGLTAYDTDLYIAGEWEYYPGQLYYRINSNSDIVSDFLNGAPIREFDYQFTKYFNQYRNESTDIYIHDNYMDEPTEFVCLPRFSFNSIYNQKPNNVSSYRMVIENLSPLEEGDMILALTGTINGDFNVFINGRICAAMMVPYGYPAYYLPIPDSGTIEIVIQTTGTTQLLNICPRLSYKGHAMIDMDNYRNTLFILYGILFTAFILMMVLIFSINTKKFRLPFYLGLVFTTIFLVSNLWATGFQDAVNSVIPQHFIPHIIKAFVLAALIIEAFILRSASDCKLSCVMPKVCIIACIAVVIIECLELTILPVTFLAAASDFLVAAIIAFLIISIVILANRVSASYNRSNIGFILMLTGLGATIIHDHFGFWNLFMLMQPVAIIIYIILIYINNKMYQTQVLQRTTELLELEKQSSKVQAAMLSSQIQPHFLYNTLTTIQELCYSDPDQAAELIVAFSQYLRNNLDFMNYDDLIPFSKELDHIHNFMYIQNARYHNSIEFVENIGDTNFYVPPLSVQPFVENAVKHGIMKENNSGKIFLSVFRSDGSIHIIIRNTGKKIRRDLLKPNHSIDNIQARLLILLKGTVNINFDDDNPDTIVEILIPEKARRNAEQ